MPASAEDQKRLIEGIDYLGRPSAISLTGGQDVSQGVQGLPAAAGPGGMSGFAGGPGARPGQAGGPDSFGLAKGALEAAAKTGRFGKEFLPAKGQDVAYDPIAAGASTVPGIEGARALTSTPLEAIDLGIGLGAGAPNVPTTFGDLSKLVGQGYSLEDIQQILGGAETVGTGGAGAASSLGGGLGTAAGGAGALAAILGLIASATGNRELGTAATGVGAAGTAAGTAGALAGGAAGGGVAGTGAATGLGAAGAGAGVLLAPIVAALLLAQLEGGADPIGEALKGTQGDFPTFVPELMQNVGQQNTAFDTLAQALPYVQTKGELGQLLNTYRNYLWTTTGIAPESYGSIEGAPGDVYSIGKIPGVGGLTHGQQTPQADFGPETQALMNKVQQLYGVLPGDPITAAYGQPGGGLEGEPAMRLWSQFMDRQRNAPVQSGGLQGGVFDLAAQGLYTGDMVSYGEPGYNYALSGFPAPGQYIGQVSPYWQQLQAAQQQAASPVAQQIEAMIGAGARPPGTGLAEGVLSEDERKRLSQ